MVEKGTDVLELADRVSTLATSASNIELAEAVTDLRVEIVRLKEDNIRLREELQEYKTQIEDGADLVLIDGVYWRGARGDAKTQPICPTCWDSKKQLIHMQIKRKRHDDDHFSCHVCKLRVNDPQGTPAAPIEVNRGGSWSP